MPDQQHPTPNDTLDPQLVKHGDKRNVIDRYRQWTVEAISHDLRQSASKLEIAVDNQPGAQDLANFPLIEQTVLIFGSEKNGISAELLQHAHAMVQIEQFGSTRSLNVGVASGIAMYEWTRRFRLS